MVSLTQTDNANLSSKLRIRRYFLDRYHGDQPFTVFDACQGEGAIWATLRREYQVGQYWGVDVKPKKGRLKVSSERLLETGVTADVIDVDTYGSPWRHWHGILSNLQAPTTVFLTVGTNGPLGSLDNIALRNLGMDKLKHRPSQVMLKRFEEIGFRYCLTAAYDYGADLVEAAESQPSKNARYIGIRLAPSTTVPSSGTMSEATLEGSNGREDGDRVD